MRGVGSSTSLRRDGSPSRYYNDCIPLYQLLVLLDGTDSSWSDGICQSCSGDWCGLRPKCDIEETVNQSKIAKAKVITMRVLDKFYVIFGVSVVLLTQSRCINASKLCFWFIFPLTNTQSLNQLSQPFVPFLSFLLMRLQFANFPLVERKFSPFFNVNGVEVPDLLCSCFRGRVQLLQPFCCASVIVFVFVSYHRLLPSLSGWSWQS